MLEKYLTPYWDQYTSVQLFSQQVRIETCSGLTVLAFNLKLKTWVYKVAKLSRKHQSQLNLINSSWNNFFLARLNIDWFKNRNHFSSFNNIDLLTFVFYEVEWYRDFCRRNCRDIHFFLNFLRITVPSELYTNHFQLHWNKICSVCLCFDNMLCSLTFLL